MLTATIEYIPNTDNNNISHNGNYRIFKSTKPIDNIISIVNITDEVSGLESLDSTKLFKHIRYSYNNQTWSLWYEYTTSPDPFITSVPFDGRPLYLQYKYLYKDGEHYDKLIPNITVNKICTTAEFCVPKVDVAELRKHFESKDQTTPSYSFNKDAAFDPYAIGSFLDLYKNMSYMVNNMFGFESLYFQTKPEADSGDFIFKEWNLYEFTNRKCIKINTNKNQFPDNMPIFNIDNDEWEEPFDVHIDDNYFKEIFGPTAEPRKKDVIYIPLNNRMYMINDTYLQRTLMAEPTFWVINLTKFRPNIDYIGDNEHTKFIDNLVLSHEDQLTEIMEVQLEDAVAPQQMKTISRSFDETRQQLVGNLKIQKEGLYFNYALLIDYYYDFRFITDFKNPAVLYKYKSKIDKETQNLTYFCLFNITDDGDLKFLNGENITDGNLDTGGPTDIGINITGKYTSALTSGLNAMDLSIYVNDPNNPYNLKNINVNKNEWYGMFVSMSAEFKHISVNIYHLLQDPGDDSNFFGLKSVINKTWNIVSGTSGTIDFESDIYYQLIASNLNLANIRLFNRTFGEEEHEFVLTSMFYRKETELVFIDNCRPELDVPYIMRTK